MVKIVRYEVYSDDGNGWQFVEQFSGEDRQEAVFCAKEVEASKRPVKIIREVYDTDDNSFQESVEYISGLKTKNKEKIKAVEDNLFDDLKGEYNVEATPFKMLASNVVSKAIMKLILIIVFSLILANILISLSVPVVEFLVPDEQRKSVLFFGFFIIFLLIAAPLLFYKIPWNVFYTLHQGEKELINERHFFRHAASLINNYNLNDNGKEVVVPVFPEAPLEYKQYIVDYLSQILNNLDVKIRLTDSFNRLGIELVVYGGCLELSRYGHLLWAEANSLLYEAFKVLEGDNVDLQAFYEAKRSYGDNKVAVFLSGVGAYLMSQVIHGIPMDSGVLKDTLEKWISSNTRPETSTEIETSATAEGEGDNNGAVFECLVNVRLSVHIYDDEKSVNDEEQNAVRADLRNMVAGLVQRFHGKDVVEAEDITSVRFSKVEQAVKFSLALHVELDEFKDKHAEYNLIMDDKVAVLEVPSDMAVNLNAYISDVLDYAYNQEIIVNATIKDELLDTPYKFEFLGDKNLRRSEMSLPLYKMSA